MVAPEFPLSARSAFELAGWYVRYGLDLTSAGDGIHAGVLAHAKAARTQHDAIDTLLKTAAAKARP